MLAESAGRRSVVHRTGYPQAELRRRPESAKLGRPRKLGRPPKPGHPHNPGDDMLSYATIPTPPGPLTVVVSEEGAVRACGWTSDVQALLPLIHPKLLEEAEEAEDLGRVSTAVRSYFGGDLGA